MLTVLEGVLVATLAVLAKLAYETLSDYKRAVKANKLDEFWDEFFGIEGGEEK